MKKFKSTWILAGLVLVLGLGVYFLEIEGGKKRQAKKEKAEKILDLDAKDVEAVTLKNAQGTFEAKRVGDNDWQLQKPLDVPADKWVWNNIVSSVSDAKYTRVISESASDLEPYGLKNPKLYVSLKLKNSKEPKVFQMGDDNPIGDSIFVTVEGTNKVVLADQKIVKDFDKTKKDLREKKLFTFEKEKTQAIDVFGRNGKKKYSLKKEADKWFITSLKEKKEATLSDVNDMLSALSFLEVKKFEDEAPKDLAPYGLKKPQLKVVLRDEKSAQLQLDIGKKDSNGVYVSHVSKKPVYQVGDSILKKIPENSDKLIQKEIKEKSQSLALPDGHSVDDGHGH